MEGKASGAAGSAWDEGDGELINGCYKVLEKLGTGAHGNIYLAADIVTKDKKVALKQAKVEHSKKLENEFEVYSVIGTGKANGIPRAIWMGDHKDYKVMAMDTLGPSLGKYFNACGRKFTMKTVLLLADQMIERLEFIHSRGILHRDLKKDNFVMGQGPFSSTLYLIDFGLATSFRDPTTGEHLPCQRVSRFVGNRVYASVNTTQGLTYSRRDDLESLGYLCLALLGERLPWAHEKNLNDIAKIKIAKSVEDLCKFVPKEFATYLNICKGLKFDEEPDYNGLRQLFKGLFQAKGFANNGLLDWVAPVKVEKAEQRMIGF